MKCAECDFYFFASEVFSQDKETEYASYFFMTNIHSKICDICRKAEQSKGIFLVAHFSLRKMACLLLTLWLILILIQSLRI